MNRSRWIGLVLFIALGLVLAAAAQQKSEETAIDPVCGMTVKIASAKATFDYQGKTYYFCSTGCKDRFAKEPEKYLAKTTAAPAAKAGEAEAGRMKGGMGMMGGHGKMASCPCCGGMGNPMMSGDVVRKVEKTADGVVVRISAKDPELIKKIQDHFDQMDKMKAAAEGCPEDCPMKKKEVEK